MSVDVLYDFSCCSGRFFCESGPKLNPPNQAHGSSPNACRLSDCGVLFRPVTGCKSPKFRDFLNSFLEIYSENAHQNRGFLRTLKSLCIKTGISDEMTRMFSSRSISRVEFCNWLFHETDADARHGLLEIFSGNLMTRLRPSRVQRNSIAARRLHRESTVARLVNGRCQSLGVYTQISATGACTRLEYTPNDSLK